VWQWLAGFGRLDWRVIEAATLVTLLSVGVIVHTYETVYLIRQRRRDRAGCQDMFKAGSWQHSLWEILNTWATRLGLWWLRFPP
jgi:hypothetical protein